MTAQLQRGWYSIPPYFTVHFFESAGPALCGVEGMGFGYKKPKKDAHKCETCQRKTGEKPPQVPRDDYTMGEVFNAHRQEKRERHAVWHTQNREAIDNALGGRYTDKGETLLFRETGMPAVDFYPSTGRWKSGKKMYRGGGKAFVHWYANRRKVVA